jgi:hypothetical protein
VATGDEQDDRAAWPPSSNGWIAGPPPGGDGHTPRSVPPLHQGAPDEAPTLRSRWTLALAVMGSVLLLGGVVLFWSDEGPSNSGLPGVALPGPWEPPTLPAGEVSVPALEDPPPSGTVPIVPSAGANPPVTGDGGAPPRTTAPTRPPAPAPTTTGPAPSQPAGPNLSLDAGSDGSSKADGTSFGDVRDDDLSTFWSPEGTRTGEISIKWDGAATLSFVNIREAAGGGRIGSWRVRNHDSGTVLATGTGARLISFSPTSLRKITFEILSASGVPRVAEFETFAR